MKVIDLFNMLLSNAKMPKRIIVKLKNTQFEGVYNEELQDYRLGRYENRFRNLYLFEYTFELGQRVYEEKNRKENLYNTIEILDGENNE